MKRLEKEKNFELDGAKGKKYIVSRLRLVLLSSHSRSFNFETALDKSNLHIFGIYGFLNFFISSKKEQI
jgi:hypothetical protein